MLKGDAVLIKRDIEDLITYAERLRAVATLVASNELGEADNKIPLHCVYSMRAIVTRIIQQLTGGLHD